MEVVKTNKAVETPDLVIDTATFGEYAINKAIEKYKPLLFQEMGKMLDVPVEKFKLTRQPRGYAYIPMLAKAATGLTATKIKCILEAQGLAYDKMEYQWTIKWATDYYGHLTFHLQQLPGCCGVGLSYHTNVNSQKKGLGTLLMAFKEKVMFEAEYPMLMMTCRLDNAGQLAVMKKRGFKSVFEWENCRYASGDRRLGLFVKVLQDEKFPPPRAEKENKK